jgi:hypothetical protein
MGDVDDVSLSPDSSDSEGSFLAAILIDEPSSYRQAKSSPEWSDWKKAMEEELESLKENDVWTVVPRPTNRKIVDSRWVYKTKSDAKGEITRYKARLVAKGFSQINGPD